MNTAKLKIIEPEECCVVTGEDKIIESYSAYLTDESRIESQAVEVIYFPENTAQVVHAVNCIRNAGRQIIVSGARTGIAGGAAGIEGADIISLERMVESTGDWRFQAGVKLEDIPEIDGRFYPVDPTEMTASVGGTAATDASGARTYYYGSTRSFVDGITVVLASGMVLELKRGDVKAENGSFILKNGDDDISIDVSDVTEIGMKNTAGIYLRKDMDLVDIFIGSEGTLGIITEVQLRSVETPDDRLFLVVFTENEEQAFSFVETMKEMSDIESLALEYFDPNALNLLREEGSADALPVDAAAAVYCEVLMTSEDVTEKLEAVMKKSGLDMDATWAGFEEKDLAEMKHFRHLIPETVNTIIGRRKAAIPHLHKIGTDTAVPDGKLGELISAARAAIEEQGVQYVIFGHVGNNHLHINMLPASEEDLIKAKELYRWISEKSVELGGTVSAEHGVGRLKKDFLKIQYSSEDLQKMHDVKNALDPDGILSPGVLF